jgi:hypothetical protein
MNTPSTTTELRAVLCETIAAVRDKSMPPDAADAISNASGKIIASLRVELEYRRMRGEIPVLPFMDLQNADVEAPPRKTPNQEQG